MPALDLRTAILLTGVMGALMSWVLYALQRSYPRSIRGLNHWATGTLLIFASTLLFSARGVLPDLLTIVLANLMMLGGTAVIGRGHYRFFQEPPRLGLPLAALGLAAPALLWFTLGQPHYPSRLMIVSGLLAILLGQQAFTVQRHGQGTLASRLVLGVQLALMLIMALRAATAPFMPADTHLLSPSPLQSLYLGSHTVGMLLLLIGLVLLANERLRGELQTLITHDMLTGLLTRRALFDQGLVELSRSERQQAPLSALVLDLDHFKQVNDRFGHLMGDRVLRAFAQGTQALLRPVDRFGRFGGEEFLLLLPDTDEAQAQAVAHRIRQARHTPSELPACTVSIGVATHQAGSPETLEGLIDRADQALYQAKAAGRDCVQLAPPPTPTA